MVKLTQTQTGKAFEFALLSELKDKLDRITKVLVVKNDSYYTAKNCLELFSSKDKAPYLLTASFAVNLLMDIEPRLTNDIGADDILELEIFPDTKGQAGDVRDVIIVRALQKWEIGISAKNNHKAVKHSRLSNDIDFGDKWLNLPCSQTYFSEIYPIFSNLEKIRKSDKNTKWNIFQSKEDEVYVPVLKAFCKELEKLYIDNPSIVPQRLISYLIGTKDFYKVIKKKNAAEIHAYNLYGTLNSKFQTIEPKFYTPQIELPTKIIDISFKENSKTTIILSMNNNWTLSFRLHNASSKIEPSLKFDVNLLKSPNTFFTNKLSFRDGA